MYIKYICTYHVYISYMSRDVFEYVAINTRYFMNVEINIPNTILKLS